VLRYALLKLATLPFLLLVMSLITFFAMHLIPGDAVDIILGLDPNADEKTRMALREQMGLDGGFFSQYGYWLSNIILRGDLGISMTRNVPVIEELIVRIPVTLELAAVTVVMVVIMTLIFGMISILYRGKWVDVLVQGMTFTGLAFPNFFIGALLIIFFSLFLPQLLSIGYIPIEYGFWEHIKAFLLPAFSFAFPMASVLSRYLRSSMLEVIEENYVRTAHAKGVKNSAIIFKHVLRNALVPVMTIFGVQIAYLIGGSVIIEQLFAIPGVGDLIITGINQRDYNVVLAGILFLATTYLIVNLIVDLLYPLVNPRISIGHKTNE
jgi:peptide/nickel transport system permease protein